MRVVSGMRPTGRLHLGHLHGVLQSWRELQNEHRCFFLVADYHALTTEYAAVEELPRNVREMVKDWLAVGIDPHKALVFRQSDVPAHAELHLILSMITPVPWLERNPTYKDQMREMAGKRDLSTYGFLGYPVLQAADILLYGAERVPVGEDQLPHLELTREIARRFNRLYGEEVLRVPQPMLTPTPRILGIDGRKMSKSYDNAIYIFEDDLEGLRQRVMSMFTDPLRARKSDPGHPETCNVFAFHRLYSAPQAEAIQRDCREARIGCVECKGMLYEHLVSSLEPIWERRRRISDEEVEELLAAGAKVASREAEQVLRRVKQKVGLGS